ncbi:MAG: NUDIX domain-containing protein [Furfurilactobacillus sp.]|jgi:isopentenyldiphosphate isomerase|uniref:NUDIX hydrolase n=1 Tax=Furfurilactobacillus TaxID=2767882 RepID=UPI001F201034|nr:MULTISPECIES: NUDIX domain-containing protein [Furfurilactobacillus]MCF6420385.1 NUDIX domain-containing protein [Furfurilactobacillus milii]MCH4012404.1 NUDIX domain-containing protein [Furfurilactobacillus sp.]MCH4038296.1 NUDIX domain-containing protein [Furfurilactobacillus sp.]MCH4115067.1 NUDIX domain-containing protein [Furfurilactobacillus sp.]MCH4133930.1 NUDIX domain-containing protein [Furfurilactobacillus sp.]
MKTTDTVDEWWDQYDERGNIVGKQQRRDRVPAGRYHLVVNAFIFDQDGAVLLQQRSLSKLNHPGAWDCSAGGSALRGESALTAIKREIDEELGLTSLVDLNWHDSFRGSDWVEDWFAFRGAFKLSAVKPQIAEVAQIALFSPERAVDKLQQQGIANTNKQLQKALNWLALQKRR